MLFHKAAAALGKPAFVIVDEAAWPDGLEGIDDTPMELPLDALDEAVTVPGDRIGLDTSRLRAAHAAVRAALNKHPDGNLQRDIMVAAGISADTGRDGYALSWRRVIRPELTPGMDPAERRALVKAAVGNKTAMRLARLFGALEALMQPDGPKASGWITLGWKDTDAGPVRVLRLRGRRKIAKPWNTTPTLILDATLNMSLVRPYWPQVQVTA
ncbi:hypothetical protein [Roseicella sp. DB1501]|uniref:hypothetical protein n=1 Tax=Roseicella sp. DB1501 TaxID=2730925 RepID=UPI001492E471|nr:hypothetical protein [Roseicella sp. DB1501]NOG74231.1 hypothetical protein [Roseicella sp. DB1501]